VAPAPLSAPATPTGTKIWGGKPLSGSFTPFWAAKGAVLAVQRNHQGRNDPAGVIGHQKKAPRREGALGANFRAALSVTRVPGDKGETRPLVLGRRKRTSHTLKSTSDRSLQSSACFAQLCNRWVYQGRKRAEVAAAALVATRARYGAATGSYGRRRLRRRQRSGLLMVRSDRSGLWPRGHRQRPLSLSRDPAHPRWLRLHNVAGDV
jgi:hypothetical protein